MADAGIPDKRLGQRISALRRKLGESQETFGGRFRVEQVTVSRWEKGYVPQRKYWARLAQLSNQQIATFIFGKKSIQENVSTTGVDYIQLIGEVAAGRWKDIDINDFEKRPIEMPHNPKYPKGAVYALLVRGNSINKQAKDGDIVICLDIHQSPRDFGEGDWVIACRKSGNKEETTVKRARKGKEGAWELWPDSDDPAFQAPLPLGKGDGETVEVIALVLRFTREATVV